MFGGVGASSACRRLVTSVTTVRRVVPVDPRNIAYSRGCATASSLRCDRSPVATRPSAGYGSFLVIVRAASVSLGRYRCHSVGGFTCENPPPGLYSRVEL